MFIKVNSDFTVILYHIITKYILSRRNTNMKLLLALQKLRNPFLDKIMVCLTRLGDIASVWILMAIIFLFTNEYKLCGVTLILAIILSCIIGNLILKNIFARKRPCWINKEVKLLIETPHDYSFPSGHTSASFAAAVAILFFYKNIGFVTLILAVLIGFSRLYLFVHYLTDVLSGVILGSLCGVASYLLVINMFL